MNNCRVLFVCAANICRSPMAEYLLKDLLKRGGVSEARIEVHSAGIHYTAGSEVSDQALQVMRERGIDMSRHRARCVDEEIVDRSDLVLCMERVHLETLRQFFPQSADKFHLLTEYCGARGDISDPSGRPTVFFEECVRELEGYLNLLKDRFVRS